MFQHVISSGDFVVLDTETTGLHGAEIVDLCVIDSSGKILIDTRIKPTRPIPVDASAIHGIYDKDVESAPSFIDISPQLERAIAGKNVVIYNASYDVGVIAHCYELAGMWNRWEALAFYSHCAMEWYAEAWGDWNDYYSSYRWQKLTTAIQQQGLTVENAHHAHGDCLMTLALVNLIKVQDMKHCPPIDDIPF